MNLYPLPPFERFVDLRLSQEKLKFFEDARVGDVIYGVVWSRQSNSGVDVRLCCLDDKSFRRDLYELKIIVFVDSKELVVDRLNENDLLFNDPFAVYVRGAYVKAQLITVNPIKRHVELAIKNATDHLDGVTTSLNFGIITEIDLPAYYRAGEQLSQHTSFDKFLRKSSVFKNPSCVTLLCNSFSLTNVATSSTFISGLKEKCSRTSEYGRELRLMQSDRLATKYVRKGVECIRNGDMVVALQHLTKALEVDNDHVEALVARGALYANSETFKLAFKDFERALSIRPNHENAAKYLHETLVAAADQKLSTNEKKPAIKLLKRAVNLVPYNKTTSRALLSLIGKSEFETFMQTTVVVPPVKQNNDLSNQLKQQQRESAANSDSSDSEPDVQMIEKNSVNETETRGDDDLPPDEAELEAQLRKYYDTYTKAIAADVVVPDKTYEKLRQKLKDYYDKFGKSKHVRTPEQAISISSTENSDDESVEEIEPPPAKVATTKSTDSHLRRSGSSKTGKHQDTGAKKVLNRSSSGKAGDEKIGERTNGSARKDHNSRRTSKREASIEVVDNRAIRKYRRSSTKSRSRTRSVDHGRHHNVKNMTSIVTRDDSPNKTEKTNSKRTNSRLSGGYEAKRVRRSSSRDGTTSGNVVKRGSSPYRRNSGGFGWNSFRHGRVGRINQYHRRESDVQEKEQVKKPEVDKADEELQRNLSSMESFIATLKTSKK